MKITNFIVCDDIRHEEGNKISLMGVYDEVITFPVSPDKVDVWPKTLSFAVYIRAAIDREDVDQNIRKIVFSAGQQNNLQRFPTTDFSPEKGAIGQKVSCVVKMNNFQLTSNSPITCEIILYNDKEEEVTRVTPGYSVQIAENIIEGARI